MAPDRRTVTLAAALTAAALSVATLVLADPAAAGDARTTRIETRPFYGATVTLEHGVRVFRALPPHERVIINPGGRTPLNLSFEPPAQQGGGNGGGPGGGGNGYGGNGSNGYGNGYGGDYGYGGYGGYGYGRGRGFGQRLVGRPASQRGHQGGYRGHAGRGPGGHGGGGRR